MTMLNKLQICSVSVLLLLTLTFSSTVASSGRVYIQQLNADLVGVIDPSVAVPGVPHGIAMTSNRDGNNEVYVMDPNGQNQSRVTDNTMNTSNDQRPDISPDGNQIVFSS